MKTAKMTAIVATAVILIAIAVATILVFSARVTKADGLEPAARDAVNQAANQASGGPTFGAVSTLEGVDSPFTSIGGFKEYRSTVNMTGSSTVLCWLKNPYATTTEISAFKFNIPINGQFGAITVDLATSATASLATSSIPIGRTTLIANAANAYIWKGKVATSSNAIPWSSTFLEDRSESEAGSTRFVLQAGEYIILRTATSSAVGGGVFPIQTPGSCSYRLTPAN